MVNHLVVNHLVHQVVHGQFMVKQWVIGDDKHQLSTYYQHYVNKHPNKDWDVKATKAIDRRNPSSKWLSAGKL